MKRWLVNGESGTELSPFDRGLTYGDGLFETIAVRGGQCRFFGAHYARLVLSCRRLGLPVPAQEGLLDGAEEVIGTDSDGTLKIVITRGAGARGYRIPDDIQPTCIIGFTPEQPPANPEAGIRVRICKTPISANPVLAGMKTLNRLEQVMARAEWDDPDIREGVMLNVREELVCGTMSNLFLVARGQLWTPVLDEAGVHGVMRSQVLDLADDLGVACTEQRLAASLLDEADDVFLTNARVGIWPVAELDGREYRRNELTLQLRRGLAERGVIECAG